MTNLPGAGSIFRQKFLETRVTALQPGVARTCSLDTSVESVVRDMREGGIGCVLVVDAENNLQGIFTERDVLQRCSTAGFAFDTAVSSVMTRNPESLRYNASIARALYSMHVGNFRHLPITGKDTVRILSIKDIVQFIFDSIAKKRIGLSHEDTLDENLVDWFFDESIDILSPDDALSVSGTSTVQQALSLMRSNNTGSILICSESGVLRGIFTERDYVLKFALEGEHAVSQSMEEIMTRSPRTVTETSTVSYAFGLFAEGGYRHLPVVDEMENLTGVVSVRNFFEYLSKSIVSELSAQFEV